MTLPSVEKHEDLDVNSSQELFQIVYFREMHMLPHFQIDNKTARIQTFLGTL